MDLMDVDYDHSMDYESDYDVCIDLHMVVLTEEDTRSDSGVEDMYDSDSYSITVSAFLPITSLIP
jgi:hypothetical protein